MDKDELETYCAHLALLCMRYDLDELAKYYINLGWQHE